MKLFICTSYSGSYKSKRLEMTQISIDRDWLNKLWYDHKFKYTVVKKKKLRKLCTNRELFLRYSVKLKKTQVSNTVNSIALLCNKGGNYQNRVTFICIWIKKLQDCIRKYCRQLPVGSLRLSTVFLCLYIVMLQCQQKYNC